MARESFVVLNDWIEAINKLPKSYQLEAYKSLMSFGLNGEIPQNISPVVEAVLTSFQTLMKSNIARYNASVENGKKGGRPPKNNLEKNLEKPNETQPNLEEPKPNLNDNVYVNDNVNVSCMFNNNACACEGNVNNFDENTREPYLKFFSETFDYYTEGKFYDAAIDIVDTMIESRKQSLSDGFKFNHKTYIEPELIKVYLNLDNDKFRKIVTQVALNKEIQDKPRYIMGCIFNAGQKESLLNSNSKLEEFEQNLGGD